MSKKMLIDASLHEEARVAIVDNQYLDTFESENTLKRQIKGNIYLAKVIRIEPSLQAAFVEYGGNRHGFLPFSEIHPDYYRIPISDREKLVEELAKLSQEAPVEEEENLSGEALEEETTELGGEDDPEFGNKNALHDLHKRGIKYKIQEVIQHRQILLIQAVKEERGNKGAAFTTYLSLPGRYCVLMPNAGYRAGGVSRKIQDGADRKRLRELIKGLEIPQGMALIVRTAGQNRNKTEIRRDFEYLVRLWNDIRDNTFQAVAPALIYAEGDLIKRAIRDMYTREVDEILVEGEDGFKKAKELIKSLIPSHIKKVKFYNNAFKPLFQEYKVEEQIDRMMEPIVKLPSGGSIVIHSTEALVAIDVNSGKSTRERHIDETAFKTNLEAAEEVARQLRLRDLGGLIVVDFIDMGDHANVSKVEKKIKDCLKNDRAKIQVGRISQFGLLEMSRQRLKPSLIETNSVSCPHCAGTGFIRSIESLGVRIMRAIESLAIQDKVNEILVHVPADIDLYLLNQKRKALVLMEERYKVHIEIKRDPLLISPHYRIEPDVNTLAESPPPKETTRKKQSDNGVPLAKSHSSSKTHSKTKQKKAFEEKPSLNDFEGTPSSPPSTVLEERATPPSEINDEPVKTEEDKKRHRRRRNRLYRGKNRRFNKEGENSSSGKENPSIKNGEPKSTPLEASLTNSLSSKTESNKDVKNKKGWLRRLLDS